MKRTVVIAQPTYLPWLGYFELMRQADVFIFLDSVQFERCSWQCRNRIKGANDEPFWLTVPTTRHPLKTAIRDVQIAPDRASWAETHLKSITAQFGRAPFFKEVWQTIEPILSAPPTHLAELNIALIRAFAAGLGLAPQFLRSSELPVTGRQAELVINLLKHVGATDYYSAAGSAIYLDEARDLFVQAGISYTYQTWEHPRYSQGGGAFVSHLAVVDALSWLGYREAAARLQTGAEISSAISFPHAV
jgi:WbqC-like protein family